MCNLNICYKNYKKKYILNQKFKVYLSNKQNLISILGTYGLIKWNLPSSYFYFNSKNLITLIFLKKEIFINFLNLFFLFYKRIFFLYWVRLKIKGLGYRIRKITTNLYYFFFNYTNMYYFNIPKNIIIKWYKKRLILVSHNFCILKIILATIIILKKLGPYRLRGLKYPKQIILIKKKKKFLRNYMSVKLNITYNKKINSWLLLNNNQLLFSLKNIKFIKIYTLSNKIISYLIFLKILRQLGFIRLIKKL